MGTFCSPNGETAPGVRLVNMVTSAEVARRGLLPIIRLSFPLLTLRLPDINIRWGRAPVSINSSELTICPCVTPRRSAAAAAVAVLPGGWRIGSRVCWYKASRIYWGIGSEVSVVISCVFKCLYPAHRGRAALLPVIVPQQHSHLLPPPAGHWWAIAGGRPPGAMPRC